MSRSADLGVLRGVPAAEGPAPPRGAACLCVSSWSRWDCLPDCRERRGLSTGRRLVLVSRPRIRVGAWRYCSSPGLLPPSPTSECQGNTASPCPPAPGGPGKARGVTLQWSPGGPEQVRSAPRHGLPQVSLEVHRGQRPRAPLLRRLPSTQPGRRGPHPLLPCGLPEPQLRPVSRDSDGVQRRPELFRGTGVPVPSP